MQPQILGQKSIGSKCDDKPFKSRKKISDGVTDY